MDTRRRIEHSSPLGSRPASPFRAKMAAREQDAGGPKQAAPRLPNFPARRAHPTPAAQSAALGRAREEHLPGVHTAAATARRTGQNPGRNGADRLAELGKRSDRDPSGTAIEVAEDVEGFESPRLAKARAQVAKNEVLSYIQQRRQKHNAADSQNQGAPHTHDTSFDDSDVAADDAATSGRIGSRVPLGSIQRSAQHRSGRGYDTRLSVDDDLTASSADQSPTRHAKSHGPNTNGGLSTVDAPDTGSAKPAASVGGVRLPGVAPSTIGRMSMAMGGRGSTVSMSMRSLQAVAAEGSLSEEAFEVFKRDIAARIIQAHWRRWQAWKAKLRRDAEERILQLLADDSGLTLRMLLGEHASSACQHDVAEEQAQPAAASAAQPERRSALDAEGEAQVLDSGLQERSHVAQDALAVGARLSSRARPASAVEPPASPAVKLGARPSTVGTAAARRHHGLARPPASAKGSTRVDIHHDRNRLESESSEEAQPLGTHKVKPNQMHAGGHSVYTFVATPRKRAAMQAEAMAPAAEASWAAVQAEGAHDQERQERHSHAATSLSPDKAALASSAGVYLGMGATGLGATELPSQLPSLDADSDPAMASPALSAATGGNGAAAGAASGVAPATESSADTPTSKAAQGEERHAQQEGTYEAPGARQPPCCAGVAERQQYRVQAFADTELLSNEEQSGPSAEPLPPDRDEPQPLGQQQPQAASPQRSARSEALQRLKQQGGQRAALVVSMAPAQPASAPTGLSSGRLGQQARAQQAPASAQGGGDSDASVAVRSLQRHPLVDREGARFDAAPARRPEAGQGTRDPDVAHRCPSSRQPAGALEPQGPPVQPGSNRRDLQRHDSEEEDEDRMQPDRRHQGLATRRGPHNVDFGDSGELRPHRRSGCGEPLGRQLERGDNVQDGQPSRTRRAVQPQHSGMPGSGESACSGPSEACLRPKDPQRGRDQEQRPSAPAHDPSNPPRRSAAGLGRHGSSDDSSNRDAEVRLVVAESAEQADTSFPSKPIHAHPHGRTAPLRDGRRDSNAIAADRSMDDCDAQQWLRRAPQRAAAPTAWAEERDSGSYVEQSSSERHRAHGGPLQAAARVGQEGGGNGVPYTQNAAPEVAPGTRQGRHDGAFVLMPGPASTPLPLAGPRGGSKGGAVGGPQGAVEASLTAAKMTSILKYLDEVELQAEQEASCVAMAPALLVAEPSTAAAVAAVLLPGLACNSHSPRANSAPSRRPSNVAAANAANQRSTAPSRPATAHSGASQLALQRSLAALSSANGAGRRSQHQGVGSPAALEEDDYADYDDDGAASVDAVSAVSGLTNRPAFLAESVYESVRVKIRRLQDDVRQRDTRISELAQEVESLQAAQRTCLLEADARLSELLAAQRAEYEAAVSRHLAFVDRLLADKEALNAKVEQLSEQLKGSDDRQERAIAKLKEGWAAELRRQKESWAAAEKQRREAWMASKAAEIKDVTVKGLEGEVQKLLARHRAELSAAQQAAAEEARRHLDTYVAQNEVAVRQLKERMARETEEAVEKERAAAATRLREVSERYEQQLQTQRMRLVADSDLRLEQMEQSRKEDKKRYEESLTAAKEAGETRLKEAEEDWRREKEAVRKAHDKQIEALREQYETGQEGWRAAMAERARKEVAERVTAIREKLLQERNEEVQAVMTRLEAEHAAAMEALKEDFRRREEAAGAKAASALKETRRAEAKMAERFRNAGVAMQAAEERLAASELTVQELRRELDSKNSTIRWLEGQVSAAKEEAAARERDVRSLGVEKAAVAAEVAAAVARDKQQVETRLAQAQQEIQDLKSRHSSEMAAVEARVRATLAKKDEVIAGLREQLAAVAAELQGTQEVLRQQQEELGDELDGAGGGRNIDAHRGGGMRRDGRY